jgi:hypothetical protein
MPETIKFVEKWIDANVTSTSKGGGSIVALDLADKCREAAAAESIALDGIELRYGSLEKIIYEAMEHAAGQPSE